MHDAIIIGGGPAGSTCARVLVQAGMHVVVVDKKRFPRDKVCAGWVTPAVLTTLDVDPQTYSRDKVMATITAFRVSRMGGREVTLRYDAPVSYGIRRCEFDDYLLQRSGAELRLGEAVKSVERINDAWRINGEIEAPLLIGAGGHFCPVARMLNTDDDKAPRRELVVAAQEIEFRLTPEQLNSCEVAEHEPQLFFCRDLAGYGWCFRKGDYLNVGLGREDNQKLSARVKAFAEELKALGRIPPDTPDRFAGHSYILYGHTQRRIVDDGVMLIGDAAGLAYPQSGEGIRTAVESGVLAARVIGELAGRYDRTALDAYAAALHERFGKPQPATTLAVPAVFRNAVAATLLRSRAFVRNVVIDRWFLHRDQEALSAG